MGAKSWMIGYSTGLPRTALVERPTLDEAATDAFVQDLFGRDAPRRIGEADLYSINPPDKEIVAGAFGDVFIVAAREFGLNNPSELKAHFIDRAPAPDVHLHAMHSVVDWFAFAVWSGGELERSLSLAPDHGIVEDIGERLPFEAPYWSGQHPAVPDDEEYMFPFHPLDLAEEALDALFGFVLEGLPTAPFVDPEEIVLLRYQRTRPWWKFWA